MDSDKKKQKNHTRTKLTIKCDYITIVMTFTYFGEVKSNI
jgi:hypothetical protein